MGVPVAVEAARLVLQLRTAQDQAGVYARLAELGPVHVMPWQAVVVSDYALGRQVLLDRHCAALDASWRDRITPGWRANASVVAFHSSLLTSNAPFHAPVRRVLAAGLSPRAVEAMRPRVTAVVEGCLDGLEEGLAREGSADLVCALSDRLPGEILCAWLGLPAEDASGLVRLARRWSAACELGPTPAQLADADLAYGRLGDYFRPVLAKRLHAPGEDVLSQWMLPSPGGGGLDAARALANAALLFLGAKDLSALTTTAAQALFSDPQLAGCLRRDQAAAEQAAEAIARRQPPIAILSRVATRDMVLAGLPLRAGRIIHVLLQPANQGGPRSGSALAFGAGAHYCPGASLTRSYLRILLPLLAHRFPALRPVDLQPPCDGVVFPRRTSLPVAQAPASPAPLACPRSIWRDDAAPAPAV